MAAPPVDRFDELRRAWIAAHQGFSTIQRRRAELLGRKVRARQRAIATAVPDPHDDTVIPPLWLRTTKSGASQVELLAVAVAAIAVPLGWIGGRLFHAVVTQLIPSRLRAFPIAALLWSGALLGLLIALIYDPAPTFAQVVLTPWFCLQLAAVPSVAGIYGLANGWLAVPGSSQWWPLTPPTPPLTAADAATILGDAEDDWAADRLYGSEPSAAPPTETLVADVGEQSDVNAGARKTAMVLGAALLGAAAVTVAALVRFGDTAPAQTARPTPAVAVAAAPAPTPTATSADQDQAVPYTASANCPAGSTSAQALTDTSSDSAWVCVRGAEGATVDGQVLHVDLGRSYVLAAVSITPGWVAKTPGGKDEWLAHRIVTRLQYNFDDTDRTVLTQDTANTHGPVTTALPHKVLASRVTVVILQTARPPASPLPPDATASADPVPPGEQDSDPVDATFAVSALKFLGHEPN